MRGGVSFLRCEIPIGDALMIGGGAIVTFGKPL